MGSGEEIVTIVDEENNEVGVLAQKKDESWQTPPPCHVHPGF